MKDSGVEWIGEIPFEWDVTILSALFGERKHKNHNLEETNLLSLSYGQIKRKSIETNEGLLPASFETYNIIEDGDIVFRLTDLQNDKRSLRTGLCKERGIITSAYVTLAKKANDDPSYMHYLFHSYDICKVFYGMGDGVRQGMNYINLKSLRVIRPPYTQQVKIGDYLNRKCAQIDAVIVRQQEAIEKLKAYKLSVITEAVTKGLNPDVPMNDSGVEWIGQIPEHWFIHKLCWDYSAMLGKMLDVKRVTGKNLHPYIKNADVQWFSINSTDLDEMDFDENETERYSVKPGDLMICEGGEIGKCAIVPDDFPNDIFYQKALHRVRKRSEKSGNIEFLAYLMLVMAKNSCFTTSPEKATIAHLPGDALRQLRLPTPPFTEQSDIVDYLRQRCQSIDKAIDCGIEVVYKLTEYKKSLIYEVVTGKREV